MTRSRRILDTLAKEIDAHRYDLDQKPGLRSVKIVIRMNQNGSLEEINFAPEFKRLLNRYSQGISDKKL